MEEDGRDIRMNSFFYRVQSTEGQRYLDIQISDAGLFSPGFDTEKRYKEQKIGIEYVNRSISKDIVERKVNIKFYTENLWVSFYLFLPLKTDLFLYNKITKKLHLFKSLYLASVAL